MKLVTRPVLCDQVQGYRRVDATLRDPDCHPGQSGQDTGQNKGNHFRRTGRIGRFQRGTKREAIGVEV